MLISLCTFSGVMEVFYARVLVALKAHNEQACDMQNIASRDPMTRVKLEEANKF